MTISIPDHWRTSWNRKYTVEMLEHALERTHEHSLDFLFEYHEGRSEEEYEIMDRCFGLMKACSVRWRRAGFIAPLSFLLRLSHFRGKIDLLEDAYVRCHAVLGQQSSRITGFEIAPRLKRLRPEGINVNILIPFLTANLISFIDDRLFVGD